MLEGIKGIFIPEVGYIDNAFQDFVADLKARFNFDTDFFDSIAVGGAEPEDIGASYNVPGVGSMNLTFFDTSYMVQGVNYFRPFIRAFIVLLMALYNVRQLLSFIRQDGGVVAGKGPDVARGSRGD